MGNCANCIHFRAQLHTKESGECLANPPVVMALPGNSNIAGQATINLHSVRPVVLIRDSCRHFNVKTINQ